MKIKFCSAVILISILSATAAQAWCPPPPPPPHHHHYYDSYYYYYDGPSSIYDLALLLQVIERNEANKAEKERAEQEKKQRIAQLRDRTAASVKTEIDHVTELANKTGTDNAIETVANYWQQKGQRTFLDDRNGKAVLKVTGFDENIIMEYIFMREFKEVTVKMSAPDYRVSEERHSYYKEPLPASPTKKYLGFEIYDKAKSPDGHLIITSVAENTAAFYLGIKDGDTLVKIDEYDTKHIDGARVTAYVENRAQAKSKVKLTIGSQGKTRTVEIQL